jgi:fumarate reductase subunit C
LFALLHSVTWYQSTAVVMPVRLGERELPRKLIFVLNIGAWVAVSAAILKLFLALRG